MDHVLIPEYLGVTEGGQRLALPRDAVTQGFNVLGKRGKGKTMMIGCMLETFAIRKQPFVVLDPPDANWGIRFAADSEGRACGPSGFDVLLIGGDHGDVPLDATAGREIARIIVDGNISAVISMRALNYTAQQRFCADFGEELFLLNRTPRHVVFEEAQNLTPQQLKFEEQKRVLYAMTKIVAEGRGLGLGFTIASQRPAKISKDVLEEADNFLALGMIGPRDLDQVTDWFKHHVSRDTAKLNAIIDDIAKLKPGDCWLLSPDWLKEIVKMHVRLRVTYHAGRTPKPGEAAVRVEKFSVTEAVEKLKTLFSQKKVAVHQDAQNLKEANAEIRRLRSELRKGPAPVAAPAPAGPKITARDLERAVERATREEAARWRKLTLHQRALLDKFSGTIAKLAQIPIDLPMPEAAEPQPYLAAAEPDKPSPRLAVVSADRPESDKIPVDKELPGGENAIMRAAAQYPDSGVDRSQLSVLTGYKRSSRDAYISRLMSKGYLTLWKGMIMPTPAGVAALGDAFEPLPTGRDLIDFWLSRLPSGERQIFKFMVSRGGDESINREVISEVTEYKRSSRDAYLSRLAARKLIEIVGAGQVKLSKNLFMD